MADKDNTHQDSSFNKGVPSQSKFSGAFKFNGSAREYFGIWIVNILLTIITLGIYSAWAKVRRNTYFNNNTEIAGFGLGYHATGGQIFKGRLLGAGVIIAANIIFYFFPLVGSLIFSGLSLLLPWLINKSLKFKARMTSYRNVRFDWHGTYLKTYVVFLGFTAIGFTTLGIAVPYLAKYYNNYIASNYSYGTTNFKANLTTKSFYWAYLIGVILPVIAIGIIGYGLLYFDMNRFLDKKELIITFITVTVSLYFIFAFVFGILCRNLLINGLVLSDVASLGSRLNPLKIIWIIFSNLFIVIFTLGLMTPWAKVRMYKYITGLTSIQIHGDMDKFIDDAKTSKSAFGAELAEFEGVDVSI